MKMKLDEAIFDKLAEILKKHDLNEIEYKDDDVKIRLARGNEAANQVVVRDIPQVKSAIQEKKENSDLATKANWDGHPGAVKSPMVGTCYLAPEPGAQNFVVLGDMVQQDQPLLIIEAMKVMNLIKAPKSGKIVHIAVSNTDPIEYGQLLVVIE